MTDKTVKSATKKRIAELNSDNKQERFLIESEKLRLSLIQEGNQRRYEKRMLEVYGLGVGDFLQYKKGDMLQGKNYVVVGIINGLVHGVGINNDHNGYIHPERMVRIDRKDLLAGDPNDK